MEEKDKDPGAAKEGRAREIHPPRAPPLHWLHQEPELTGMMVTRITWSVSGYP